MASRRKFSDEYKREAVRLANKHNDLGNPPQNRVLRTVLSLGGLDLLEIKVCERVVVHTMGITRELIRWGSE